jgi:hypothetical protein
VAVVVVAAHHKTHSHMLEAVVAADWDTWTGAVAAVAHPTVASAAVGALVTFDPATIAAVPSSNPSVGQHHHHDSFRAAT